MESTNSEFSNLKVVVVEDNFLKKMLSAYIRDHLKVENKEITLETVLNVLAEQFPELLLTIAEENFIRGYEQALTDVASE